MRRKIALALAVSALALAQTAPKAKRPSPRAPSPATRWGQITGQLPNQQDLQAALDAKVNKGEIVTTSWGQIGGDIKVQADLQAELNKRVPLNTQINAQSGTAYTINQSDAGALIILNNAGVTTVTIPANLPLGFSCVVMQLGGEITFAGNGAALRQRQNFTKSAGPYAVVSILGYAPNTYVLSGDMK